MKNDPILPICFIMAAEGARQLLQREAMSTLLRQLHSKESLVQ